MLFNGLSRFKSIWQGDYHTNLDGVILLYDQDHKSVSVGRVVCRPFMPVASQCNGTLNEYLIISNITLF